MQEVMAFPSSHRVAPKHRGAPYIKKARALFGVCWALANFLGLELVPAEYPDAFWEAVVKDLANDAWRAALAAREPCYGTPHNNFATNVLKVSRRQPASCETLPASSCLHGNPQVFFGSDELQLLQDHPRSPTPDCNLLRIVMHPGCVQSSSQGEAPCSHENMQARRQSARGHEASAPGRGEPSAVNHCGLAVW